MIYFQGRPANGFALGAEDDRLEGALLEILNAVKAFGSTLSPREKIVLEIGLTASHMEESLAHGDWKRAEAHMGRLVELLDEFRQGTARGGSPSSTIGEVAMIYLNSRPVAGFVGDWQWPWGSKKWRQFFGFYGGKLWADHGPLWLSDEDAWAYGVKLIAESPIDRLYRLDWDPFSKTWAELQPHDRNLRWRREGV